MAKIYTYSKAERLYRKKDIQELFSQGSSFYLFPFKIISLKSIHQDTHQILISVSKRNFRKASDRNRIKRQIRESYRLNKLLLEELEPLNLAYIYTSREKLPYEMIRKSMERSLKKLCQFGSKDNL